jgi:asparagine synthase (glutamine-hydrolysing)
MCGICGAVYSNPKKPVDRKMLERMTDIMTHRGPDKNGFFVSPGIGMGIRRLSIIDLQTGDQPVSNEDGTITLVCNGEIYNFRELREKLLERGHRFKTNSDVEVIVHLYEDHGERCVDYLRGMFGFALWDASRRRLMLARDRLGIKPLHYSLSAEGLFFGSEQKSILMSGRIERQIDILAMEELLNAGWVSMPRTLFRRIRQLRPGYYLLYQDGSVSIHKYWDLHFPVPGEFSSERNEGKWAESFRAKLEETVQIHLRSDVPVGAWLSAGVDSSSVAGLMSRLSNHSVQTFTLAFENPQFDEIGQQKILSDFPAYNFSHKQTICTKDDFELFPKAIWHCEDPFPAGATIPRMLLARLAANDVKVVLVGEGSDEVLGGYPWFRTYKLLYRLSRLPLSFRRFVAGLPPVKKQSPRISQILMMSNGMNLETYRQMIKFGPWDFDRRIFSDDLNARLTEHETEDEALPLPDNYNNWHVLHQFQYFEMKVYLAEYINRSVDSTSMAYSLEARVPFLDHELIEFCANIPLTLKMQRLKEKYILRRAMQDVLPAEILQRKKRGLTAPYGQWLRNLPDFATELLSEKSLLEKGYFNPVYIRDILDRHKNGKTSYERLLIRVLGVQVWDDLFLKGCSP